MMGTGQMWTTGMTRLWEIIETWGLRRQMRSSRFHENINFQYMRVHLDDVYTNFGFLDPLPLSAYWPDS